MLYLPTDEETMRKVIGAVIYELVNGNIQRILKAEEERKLNRG